MRTIIFSAKYIVIAAVVSFLTGNVQAVEPKQVLDGFVQSIKNSKKLTALQKKKILSDVQQRRTTAEQQSSIITDAFVTANTNFEKALDHLGEEEIDQSIAILSKLQKSSSVYFAAEAKYYSARAYLMNEDYEKAEPLLMEITSKLKEHSLNVGEAMFHLGVTQVHLLKRDKAKETLLKFRQRYKKTASQRQLMSVDRQLQELDYLEKGSLVDIEERMNYSRRRLWLEKSGNRTRGEQDNIIAMLDKLIDDAEQKEGNNSSGEKSNQKQPGDKEGDKKNSSNIPANRSTLPSGEATESNSSRISKAKANTDWGKLPEKERQKALIALKKSYPERHEIRIKEYAQTVTETDK